MAPSCMALGLSLHASLMPTTSSSVRAASLPG
eukprot:CAMPEP_0173401704 /NCGR_PEP_ID=MMETSP1356-20130122/51717_1 /TAXON_ID=77927 ORGANISM="Hemiselmis virescens, Strain PCC157" /NCGR_SAMPLE_ID=MMETSP1356 /ASSEMBLY_ACC=CAM_ASM_000847 /LENGTH=31 /DNA_ID= /DNA_START= /DNA_END= /DNA_ORIENTATION=